MTVNIIKPRPYIDPWVPSYADYQDARKRCGYDEEFGMIETVWNGTDAKFKRDAIRQYDEVIAVVDRYKDSHGDIW